MKRKHWIWAAVAAVVAVGGYFGYEPAKLLVGLRQKGFFDAQSKGDYEGTVTENLKALRTAVMFYNESEGQLPDAKKWMDAISNRLQTNDLKPGEGAKKLIDPSAPPGADHFGFAFNDAVSNKYLGDVKDPDKTPLVFQSSDLAWNAHGVPEKLLPRPPRGRVDLAISVSGKVLRLNP